MEHADAMPLALYTWYDRLARFLAVSLCLQTWVVVGHSRTGVVVAGVSWNSLLPSKAQACFVGGLPTLAAFAVNFFQSIKSYRDQSVAAGVSPANFRATDTVATTETCLR